MSEDAAPYGPYGLEPRTKWAAARLVRRVWRRFREGLDRLPDGAGRRWGVALGVGALLTAALSVGGAFLGRYLADAGAFGDEAGWLRWLAEEGPLSFKGAVWVEIPGNSLVVLPLMLLAAGASSWHFRPLQALTFVVGYVLMKGYIGIMWYVWHRPRPQVIQDGLLSPQGFGAFPSGHVVQATFVYGLLVYLWMRSSGSWIERALALVVLLVLVGASAYGRLRVGAHWPSDIVGGAILGALWLGVAIFALRYARNA